MKRTIVKQAPVTLMPQTGVNNNDNDTWVFTIQSARGDKSIGMKLLN